jgi:hypothetical protein
MLFKANPYSLLGKTQPGKIHGLQEPNAKKEHLVTLCGLTAARCPGELIEGDNDFINCKNCLARLTSPIKGKFSKKKEESFNLEEDREAEGHHMPRLTLKHEIDTRFSSVQPGNFVYHNNRDDGLELAPPIEIIVLRAEKSFIQRTGPGETPILCRTNAELAQCNGTITPWAEPNKVPFQVLLDTLLLIEHPALAIRQKTPWIEYAESKGALATYRAKASAYQEISSVLLFPLMYARMKGEAPTPIWERKWKLGATMKPGSSFSYWVPILKPVSRVSPAESKALREIAENL